jgi:hypothetical protein
MKRSSKIFRPPNKGNLAKQLSELIDQLHIDQVSPAIVLARLLVVLRDAVESRKVEKQSVTSKAQRGRRLARQNSARSHPEF